jgi:hypothetical protein
MQAWRIAALSRLTSLRSLTLEPDLRPEALAALSSLRGLLELTLSGSSHISHPGSSLRALCGLTQLTGLAFNWTGGRCDGVCVGGGVQRRLICAACSILCITPSCPHTLHPAVQDMPRRKSAHSPDAPAQAGLLSRGGA